MTTVTYEVDGAVGIVTLAKPPHNLIDDTMIDDLVAAYSRVMEAGCRAILLRSSMRHFCAGAELKSFGTTTLIHADQERLKEVLQALEDVPIPTVAALNGGVLGGGLELALTCDMIIAADTAKFGQPEITIGTMPGMGGTQRLPRAVGKAKAMDWCLTGRMIDAAEAERSGLVARVVPADKLFDEALAVATRIAGFSLPVVLKIKEAINRAYESSLSDGLLFERREFHSTFALEDQKEGMRAFVDKRKPDFKHR